MTFMMPEDGNPAITFLQPGAPILLGMRTWGSLQEMQMTWWQGWLDLWAPASPQRRLDAAETAGKGDAD